MKPIYKELIALFSKLGFFAYGGPAAHTSMMSEEVVDKRKWFDEKEFMDMLSFTNVIPGPNSTEMAILIGYKKGKLLGLFLAGISFIIPAVVIVLFFTAFYLSFQQIPQVRSLFEGMVPAIFVIISAAVYKLSKKSLNSLDMIVVFMLSLVLLYLGLSEILVLLIGGFAFFIKEKIQTARLHSIEPFSLTILFLTFLKIGSFLYGSGYVLISFIQTEFVERLHWLSMQEMIDMVAIGEITPGPVFTTATAVGYLLGGVSGGLIATLGIFIPSFLLISLIYPLYEQIKNQKWLSHFLNGLNAASLAIMASVAIQLAMTSINQWFSILFAVIALVAVIRYNMNSMYLLLAGTIFGLLFY